MGSTGPLAGLLDFFNFLNRGGHLVRLRKSLIYGDFVPEADGLACLEKLILTASEKEFCSSVLFRTNMVT